MSEFQVRAHLDHHRRYVEDTAASLARLGMGDLSLEDAVTLSARIGDVRLERASNQAWNHHLFWHSLSPIGGGKPPLPHGRDLHGEILRAASESFGSGWTWVTLVGKTIQVIQTPNEVRCPGRPLLCLDLWEHAYYIDHLGNRASYVSVFLDRLVNWDFAMARLDGYDPQELM